MKRTKQANILILTISIIIIGTGFLVSGLIENTRIALIISQSIILIPAIIYVILTRQNLFKLIRFRKINIQTFFLVILFTYCMMPLLNLVNAISMLFSTNLIKGAATNIMGDNLLLGLFMVAIIPAVVEETTYRGVLYNTYKPNGALKAIFLSGLVFGAVHMNFNQFFYAAFLGIVMALVIEATDSICSSMLMHFIFNGNSVMMLYLLPKMQKFLESYGQNESTKSLMEETVSKDQLLLSIMGLAPVAVFTTTAAVFVFIAIARRNQRLDYIKSIFKKPANKVKGNRVIDIFFILTILVCLGFAFYTEFAIRSGA